jgi:2-polyprenyl-3-methyl-5-hydroxy-6-metoxy-1,4-benzoquinol methylase
MRSSGDMSQEARLAKAEKIAGILQDARSDLLAGSLCLDLGCGIGVMANHLGLQGARVVGMELDWALISRAPAQLSRVQGDALQLPFSDAVFDLVVCAQVYEHTGNPVQLVKQIKRVLKPGGICFFSGPNRLWPYEYHYQMWLVHWLPEPWITKALSLIGRSHLPKVTLLNWWQLRQLWKGFMLWDYTHQLVRYPKRFPGADAPDWMRYLPLAILKIMAVATPNVNWVLMKPAGEMAGIGGSLL